MVGIVGTMTLPRLETNTRVGDQAFEALHAAILSGEYEAGRRLQIRDLAAQLGISVMPVREAIKRLEEVGLVETQPYKGAVVKQFTLEELLHIYTVRRLLEVEATRQGVATISPDEVTRLEGLYRDLEDALAQGEVVTYLDLDEQILLGIYAAAGNPILLETIRMLWDRCRHYKIVGARDELESGSPSRLLTYQERLLAAAKAADGDTAAMIARESIDAAIERIRQALSDKTPTSSP